MVGALCPNAEDYTCTRYTQSAGETGSHADCCISGTAAATPANDHAIPKTSDVATLKLGIHDAASLSRQSRHR